MGREARFRKDLSMPGMHRCFERIEDVVSSRGPSLSDCLMSGLAIFALKHPSPPRFDRDVRGLGEASDEPRRKNLRSLFGIGRAPSDSRMRERLDALGPKEPRRAFKRLFAPARRGAEGVRVAGWAIGACCRCTTRGASRRRRRVAATAA